MLGPRLTTARQELLSSSGTRRNEVERLFGRELRHWQLRLISARICGSWNAARMARSLVPVAPSAWLSIVHALCIMSNCLKTGDLLADALKAARSSSPMRSLPRTRSSTSWGRPSGGILGLLRLYRDTQSEDVLMRAVKCGQHLMGKPRLGSEGRRSWVGQGFGSQALNGMSHGAAGFGRRACFTGDRKRAGRVRGCGGMYRL